MNRRMRTEILIRGSRSLARDMAKQIFDKYQVKTIEEPNYGLAMIKMREAAQNTLFYLGEVLVTEAKVHIENQLGIGIVSGNDTELSHWLAIVDAAYNASLKETLEWEEKLNEEHKNILEEEKRYKSKILMTKVNFDTMDV
ncbi:phosphonate metabolism protein PhnG [Oxobacter pfennigii]|uniref:Phosphonate metabolism protein PhnG n=1 Tax=Oxobacter pfennigii TaxID=36849 RepID=A0A0P9ABW7_9CLOT|nr:phosphonate C-P lyase system protein PhnG [Oxobacter pfennigii]KPU42593.1 phosphonate metabolism protein PhnG [Oxobacter pfennigii]